MPSFNATYNQPIPWQRILGVLAVIGIGLAVVCYQQQRAYVSFSPTVAHNRLYDCAHDAPLPPAESTTLMDATDAVNLHFVQAVGPLGTYYMPESVGSGGALADFDNDGLLDLFLVNCGASPGAVGEFAADVSIANGLYRMENGKFVDVTSGSGVEQLGYGMGCAVGDVDNDGDVDLYVTTVGQDRLLLNQGDMTFVDVTQAAGFADTDWGTGAAFLDYDRDGLLDLVVVNYARDERYQFSVACGIRKGHVSYCSPNKFSPTIDRLYHNDGLHKDVSGEAPGVSSTTPHFTDVTDTSGLSREQSYGLAVVSADLTGDGWVDIYISNDAHPNRLWVNQQDGTFNEEAVARGVAVNRNGYAEGSMGIAVGDLNRDLSLDLVVTNLSGESTTLYLNDGSGHFQDHTEAAGLVLPSRRHTGWGAALIDLDQDGDLDLPLVNGLVIPCHSGFPPHGEDRFQQHREQIQDVTTYWRDYHDRNKLLLTEQPGRLRDVTVDMGGDFSRAAGSGRSLIYGDPDEDGDLDLIVTNSGSRARYYRNDLPKRGHWLRVRLVDPRHQRDALGAEVTVASGDQIWKGVVLPTTSYLASNDPRVYFGLGAVSEIDRIVVRWPDGPVETCIEEFTGTVADADVTLQRGQGTLVKEPQ